MTPTDIDVLDYYPLARGRLPPSSVRTTPLATLGGPLGHTFQLDKYYHLFRENKLLCQAEGPGRYFACEPEFDVRPINEHIVATLCVEHPGAFERAGDELLCRLTGEALPLDGSLTGHELFAALAMQVPEDVAVLALRPNGTDWVTHAHLTSASEWSATWAVGRSFADIHEAVRRSDGELVIRHPAGMVRGVVNMPGPVQRVGALTFRPDLLLNRHPDRIGPDRWDWGPDQLALLRFERQTVTPFRELGAFLFTVRTYYCDLTRPDRLPAAVEALSHPEPEAYQRRFLAAHGSDLLSWLRARVKLDRP